MRGPDSLSQRADHRGGPPPALSDHDFRQLAAFIHAHAGIFLHPSKQEFLRARLRRRLQHYRYSSFREYYAHLIERDPEGYELGEIVNAVTTNRTEFFREAHHFAVLQAQMLARHRPSATSPDPPRFRVWSAGCSTGEEPYTIAFTIATAWPGAFRHDVRILASDIDTTVLARASAAVYPLDRLTKVPRAVRDQYFVLGRRDNEGLVRVRQRIRAMVTFRKINLCEPAWPIRAKFDAIFCRNVLIYFDREAQHRIVERLVDHLVPGGYLYLGHSESLLGMRPRLRYVRHTVYEHVPAEARA